MKSSTKNVKRALLSIVATGLVASVAAFSGSADAFVSAHANRTPVRGTQVSAVTVDGMVTPATAVVGAQLAVGAAGMVYTHYLHGKFHMGGHAAEPADARETAFDY